MEYNETKVHVTKPPVSMYKCIQQENYWGVNNFTRLSCLRTVNILSNMDGMQGVFTRFMWNEEHVAICRLLFYLLKEDLK